VEGEGKRREVAGKIKEEGGGVVGLRAYITSDDMEESGCEGKDPVLDGAMG